MTIHSSSAKARKIYSNDIISTGLMIILKISIGMTHDNRFASNGLRLLDSKLTRVIVHFCLFLKLKLSTALYVGFFRAVKNTFTNPIFVILCRLILTVEIKR